jgi:molybdopterin-guanine dinucleotide biosynthesis protein A
MNPINPALIGGIILAGGRATRMGGGDKALVTLEGQTLLARTITRVRPQVGRLILSANGDPARFNDHDLPVLADPIGDHWGPLAGILAGLEYFRAHRPEISVMASFPTDSPFLPLDLVARLADCVMDCDIAMAESGGRLQPVFALWKISLAEDLRQALLGGVRKVDQFAQSYKCARVAWPEADFFNINRPDDLQQAASRLHVLG